MVIHGRAQLPGNQLSLLATHAAGRYNLLRAGKIPAVNQRIFRCNTAVLPAAAFQSVVDNHIRLILPHHLNQLCRLPLFSAHIVIGKVKPENVQLSVACHQLLYLTVHIFQIPVEVDFFIPVRFAVPHRVLPVSVFWKIRVMPVDNRKIKSCFNFFLPERIQKLSHQIPAGLRIGGLVVCQRRVEQAKAVVMLCR